MSSLWPWRDYSEELRSGFGKGWRRSRPTDSDDADYKEQHRRDHHNESQRHAEPRPLGAFDAEGVRRDDVGDVARDQHAAGYKEAEQRALDLRLAEGRRDLGRRQRRVVEDRRDYINPEKDERRYVG